MAKKGFALILENSDERWFVLFSYDHIPSPTDYDTKALIEKSRVVEFAKKNTPRECLLGEWWYKW